MSTIFEFCLPYFTYHHDQFLDFFQNNFFFPLSLGVICSYWRDIAWSTPSLWSSLVVRVTSKHDPHIIAGIAQEWLARSGQLPLSIRISAYNNNLKTVSAPVGPILTSASLQAVIGVFMRSTIMPLHLNPFDFPLSTMRRA